MRRLSLPCEKNFNLSGLLLSSGRLVPTNVADMNVKNNDINHSTDDDDDDGDSGSHATINPDRSSIL